jgi:hypothetical protein
MRNCTSGAIGTGSKSRANKLDRRVRDEVAISSDIFTN